jgi:hypothetical protein
MEQKMTPDGEKALMKQEGTRRFAYWDFNGKPIDKHPQFGNPTIGIGRNLIARGLSDDEILYLFRNDIASVENDLRNHLRFFDNLSGVSQDILSIIHFNTGDIFKWYHLLSAAEKGDADAAAKEITDSAAARQLPERYKILADVMRNQSWGNV